MHTPRAVRVAEGCLPAAVGKPPRGGPGCPVPPPAPRGRRLEGLGLPFSPRKAVYAGTGGSARCNEHTTEGCRPALPANSCFYSLFCWSCFSFYVARTSHLIVLGWSRTAGLALDQALQFHKQAGCVSRISSPIETLGRGYIQPPYKLRND